MSEAPNLMPAQRKVRIGIDASSANQEKRTGVGWYSYRLIQALKSLELPEGVQMDLLSPTPLGEALATLPNGWTSSVLSWPLARGWMQGRMSIEILKNTPRILFVPAQALPMFSGGTTLVTTIHDIGFVRKKDAYTASERRAQQRATKKAVKHAKAIFVPSAFTKRELIEVFSAREEQVHVTPLAPSESGEDLSDAEARRLVDEVRIGTHYFLYVGRIETKKNTLALIQAFEQFKAQRGVGDPFELVLVGGFGTGGEQIKKYVQESSVRSSIRALGYQDQTRVDALHRQATAYVFPSWYEGFSLTPLEAMAKGVPVIASDIPVHREVLGSAALFVPPEETDDLARAMHTLARDPDRRAAMKEEGLRHSATYTWQKTAQATWEVMLALI